MIREMFRLGRELSVGASPLTDESTDRTIGALAIAEGYIPADST